MMMKDIEWTTLLDNLIYYSRLIDDHIAETLFGMRTFETNLAYSIET